MRLLSVAERELRAAARHRGLHHLRWIAAAAAFGLLLWLGWAFDVFQNKSAGPQVFRAFATAIFVYCLFIGAAVTADCLSRERREGTLGLLFLTNLHSTEIVAGKLCANALAVMYSLLAIFPVLALPVLAGGVTLGEFWRTVLALVNGLFFAVAAGFAASSVSVRQFPAVALATGLALGVGAGLAGLAEALRNLGVPRSTTDWLATFSPLHTLFAAFEVRRFNGPARFWFSLPAVAVMSWTLLLLVAWWLSRTWRDRPKNARRWGRTRWSGRLRQRGLAARTALRRRLLGINPFFWLASRQRVSAPVFMLFTLLLVLLTVGLTGPFFSKVMRVGTVGPVVGHLFAWVWTDLALHALVLYYGATVASQRLAEDKQSGALELILSTPTSEQSISRGLWLAYGRRMFFPALIAVLVHVYFIWQVLTLMVLDPPGKLPQGVTEGQIFWSAIFGQPLKGQVLDWQFGMILRSLLVALGVVMVNWVMLGWLGRWLGLWMKRPGFAPMTAVALTLVPPALLFALVCYVCEQWHLFRLPDRQFVPLMMWVAVGIAMANCVWLSAWAAFRLHRDFRTTVTSRYDPPSPRRWWPSWRTLLRFAAGATALVLLLAMLVLTFYGYQTWRSKRNWASFQKQLQQRNESLDLAAVLPGPVPAGQNFALSPALQSFVKSPSTIKAVTPLLSGQGVLIDSSTSTALHMEWLRQSPAKLDTYLVWLDPSFNRNPTQDRQQIANAVLNKLGPLRTELDAIAQAARLRYFQVVTEQTANAVYGSNHPEHVALEQIHFLLQVRAIALIALDRGAEAADDAQTSLRLAALAGQSPDVKSTLRLQVMLMRSLQPIWEGLVEHRWNEAQLAAIQTDLARFDLLTHYTNTVHLVVLAHVETWSAVPKAASWPRSVPQGGGVYVQRREWAWQPRTRWYDNCIQFYEAGRNTIARVDPAAGRVSAEYNWSDLNGLPLDQIATQLFQQGPWWGNNGIHVSLAQTAVNQAVIACALERYRLARGAFPESLDELATVYLDNIPRDLSRGRPMFYQRDDQGGYVLRGAGFNGTIDPRTTPSDDWLWAFATPTNAPPAGARRN